MTRNIEPVYKKIISAASVITLSLVVASCSHDGKLSSVRDGSTTSSSDSYTYTVRGKQYRVDKGIKRYSKEGIASWYGPGFHGKKTANGEIYNQNAMTAAHKTLPLGSVVEVRNLDNGKKITVRINDRGPFIDGRIIDLSKKGAERIGMIESGIAKVKVTLVKTAGGEPADRALEIEETVLASSDSGASRYTAMD